MGLRTTPHIVQSNVVDTPTVIGWLRPVVVLPVAAIAGLTPLQVEAFLAHELAHVQRHDYLVNVFQAVAETLLFYHPAVWWVSARIRAERENCCDDIAVRICGEASVYADALVELEASRVSSIVLAPAATGGSLAARVRRILQVPDEHVTLPASTVLAVALALVVVVAIWARTEEHVAVNGSIQPATASVWELQTTDHFDIYYQAQHAAFVPRVASEAEAAYAQLRTDLRHDLGFKVNLMAATEDELRTASRKGELPPPMPPLPGPAPGPTPPQQTVRIFVPVDRLEVQSRLLAHEITHRFVFDILPRWGAGLPVWLPEGLAEYVAGVWTREGISAVHDVVRTESIPSMSQLESMAPDPVDAQMRHLGHAAFDFIAQEFGKAGIRRFLLALRGGSSLGGPTAYQTAFDLTRTEFDRQFARYLQERYGQTAQVFDPGNDVTMPVVVKEVKPQYTPAAMAAQIEGSVLLESVVREDGTIGDVKVVKSLDQEYGRCVEDLLVT